MEAGEGVRREARLLLLLLQSMSDCQRRLPPRHLIRCLYVCVCIAATATHSHTSSSLAVLVSSRHFTVIMSIATTNSSSSTGGGSQRMFKTGGTGAASTTANNLDLLMLELESSDSTSVGLVLR